MTRGQKAMRYRLAASLGVTLVVGPCVTIESYRSWGPVYMCGEQDNTINSTVTKDMQFDPEATLEVTGIKATASATANVTGGSATVKPSLTSTPETTGTGSAGTANKGSTKKEGVR